jgi:adenylate cyclase
MKPAPLPAWFVLVLLSTVLANFLAVMLSFSTFEVMGGFSDFAVAVRVYDSEVGVYYNPVSFIVIGSLAIGYLWPIVRFFRQGTPGPASLIVRRRVISAPLVTSGLGFAAWLFGTLFFPLRTFIHFGRWSGELMSQEILSPLVSGFLATTTAYLLLDWIFRSRVIPRVFPDGHIPHVPGALALGVRARLLVFLMAVAFTPLFTMLGLVRAAVVRIEGGVPVDTVTGALARGSTVIFAVYVLLGIGLALVLARSLIRPLGEMAAALRRVEAGDLAVGVQVNSNDEVGVLADGVNAMVVALRDNARILQTFGRIVEPSVRDRLLAGTLELGGELRTASVLFCDLRNFTAMAERLSPGDVVATLNGFFAAMTVWVRECGGFVDKFIGDALLVVFGLFEAEGSSGHAAAALRCAVGMRQHLAALNVTRGAAGHSPLAIAVGVHSGEVLAGTIGALDRLQYTVIGDTVNVAARVQQLCKELNHDVLVSKRAFDLAYSAGFNAELMLRTTVTLRGREEPVDVVGLT